MKKHVLTCADLRQFLDDIEERHGDLEAVYIEDAEGRIIWAETNTLPLSDGSKVTDLVLSR